MAQKTTLVIDPDNVNETVCNGPMNLSFHGPANQLTAVLTFTQPRPDATRLFQGSVEDRSVVKARIAMSTPNLLALRDLLAKHVKTESEVSTASGGGAAIRH